MENPDIACTKSRHAAYLSGFIPSPLESEELAILFQNKVCVVTCFFSCHLAVMIQFVRDMIVLFS